MSKPPRKRPGPTSTLKPSSETLIVGGVPPVTQAPFVQPEAPAPVEGPAAKSAPQKKKAAAPASGGADLSAREAFEASVMLARKHPRQWKPYSVRLPEELWARLRSRVRADQPSYGVTVAMSHYINAALARAPESAEEATALAQEQLDAQGLHPPETHSSGTRLHQDVLKQMKDLGAQIQETSQGGLLGHLQAAALEVFLDELDKE